MSSRETAEGWIWLAGLLLVAALIFMGLWIRERQLNEPEHSAVVPQTTAEPGAEFCTSFDRSAVAGFDRLWSWNAAFTCLEVLD